MSYFRSFSCRVSKGHLPLQLKVAVAVGGVSVYIWYSFSLIIQSMYLDIVASSPNISRVNLDAF